MWFLQKKILSSADIKLLRGVDWNTFQKRLSYHLKKGKLIKIRKWIYLVGDTLYSLEREDFFVLANMLYSPSYLSFETVLSSSWAIFQYYDTIFVAGLYKKSLSVSLKEYQIFFEYSRLPKELLVYSWGLIHKNWYTMAWFERAFCDTLRRNPHYYFDRLSLDMFDRNILDEILGVYSIFNSDIKKTVLSTLERYGINMAISA